MPQKIIYVYECLRSAWSYNDDDDDDTAREKKSLEWMKIKTSLLYFLPSDRKRVKLLVKRAFSCVRVSNDEWIEK